MIINAFTNNVQIQKAETYNIQLTMILIKNRKIAKKEQINFCIGRNNL